MTEQSLFRSKDKVLKPQSSDLRPSHQLSKAGRNVEGLYHDAPETSQPGREEGSRLPASVIN